MTNTRDFDVVLFGATGYTGQLVADHLAAHGGGARLALAGRNRERLQHVASEIRASTLPLLVGDGQDPAFVTQLAKRAKVVCTTVGPYSLYGERLVAACVDQGTSYCDLTGEVNFVRNMIDRYEERARQSGARIVHSCGFDSIPSDLGTFYLQEQARARWGAPADEVRARVTKMRGGSSGGTIASGQEVMKATQNDPALRKLLLQPYCLNPTGEQSGPDPADRYSPQKDPDFGWTGPFIMAACNTRIVRRTNAVLGYPYGRNFRYDEAIATGRGVKGLAAASGISVGTIGMVIAMTVPPLRKLSERYLPKPGEGPTREQRETGYFVYELVGTRAADKIRVRVSADRDPGYGATSKMLGQAALCLALDADRLPVQGGSWTPASAMGMALVDRLNKVGVRFEVA
jgi:short subunit dehydrogenase-like uncharacterized protein